MTNEIKNHVDSFVSELGDLIRQQALQSVRDALGTEATTSPETTRTKTDKPQPAALVAPKRKSAAKPKTGEKRAAADIEALIARIHAYISANPGLGAEAIAAGLGVSTKDLALPIRKLVAEKKLKTKGQKRGTRYTAK